jgi:hypothetical protein
MNKPSSILHVGGPHVGGPIGGRVRGVLQELVDSEARIYGPGHHALTHRGERRAQDLTRALQGGLRRGLRSGSSG